MSTRILFTTDFHLRVMRPVSRLDDDFLGAQLKKLEYVRDLAKGCDATIFGGDITDRPDAPHSLVIKLMQVLRKWPHTPWTVVGNHDLMGYSKESLKCSALGVLLEHGAIKKLDFLDMPSHYGNIQIYGIHAYDDGKWVVPDGPEKKILVCHKMITNKSIPNANCIMVDDIAKVTNADMVLSGDIHTPHSVIVNGKVFLNPGSLSRMSIVDKDRQPAVAIITIADDMSISHELVSVPAVVGDMAFDIKGYDSRMAMDAQTNSFVRDYASVVMSVKSGTRKIADVLSKFMKDNSVPKVTQDIVNGYYQVAEVQVLKASKEE